MNNGSDNPCTEFPIMWGSNTNNAAQTSEYDLDSKILLLNK